MQDLVAGTDKTVAALVAALAAVLTGIISALVSLRAQRTQRLLQSRQEQQQHELARLSHQLEAERTRNKALIDYQFDARKRLYEKCEPLFFQLTEASDHALRKCRDLAKPSTWQDLEPTRLNSDAVAWQWMLSEHTEVIAVTYALLIPVAIVCLLKERMTQVDLSLDESAWFRYLLGRQLYEC